MNKRKCLNMCLAMWDHIGINGCSKEDANKMLGLGLSWQHWHCPCCEYSGYNIEDGNCKKCPIVWPVTHETSWYDEAPCCKSYFGDWCNRGQEKVSARKIAELSLKTLNRLYPEDI